VWVMRRDVALPDEPTGIALANAVGAVVEEPDVRNLLDTGHADDHIAALVRKVERMAVVAVIEYQALTGLEPVEVVSGILKSLLVIVPPALFLHVFAVHLLVGPGAYRGRGEFPQMT